MTVGVKGHLVEVFSSIEGEGPHLGCRTLFFRFAGCDFGCDYCDTPYARGAPPNAFTVHAPGAGRVRLVPNPIEAEETVGIARELDAVAGPHRRISLTGGEPLEQPDFAAAMAYSLRRLGLQIVLETRGTLAGALDRLCEAVDVISMDIKVPSATGRPEVWNDHAAFLSAVRGPEVVVKVVADERLTEEEVEKVINLLETHEPPLTVVLQPMRKAGRSANDEVVSRLLKAQSAMLRRLADVRFVPQIHPILGLP